MYPTLIQNDIIWTLLLGKDVFLLLRKKKDEANLDKCVMWPTYFQVFRQVTVINLYESLFSKNTAGCPLAAGVICLGAPLQER